LRYPWAISRHSDLRPTVLAFPKRNLLKRSPSGFCRPGTLPLRRLLLLVVGGLLAASHPVSGQVARAGFEGVGPALAAPEWATERVSQPATSEGVSQAFLRQEGIFAGHHRGRAGEGWAAAALLAGAAALAPFDLEISESARANGNESLFVRRTGEIFRFIGFPGSVLVVGGLYGAGELTDRPDLARLGLHGAQAVVLAETATYATKALVGRARPRVSPDDPYDFRFGRGLEGGDFRSLPSGHTTAAFAVGSALSGGLGDRHPGARRWVSTVLYLSAGLAGLSRLHHDEHWASDVAAGAAIGTASGWAVTEFHRHRGR